MSDSADEHFLAQLRGSLAQVDPVPATALELAHLIPSMARLDAELATLVESTLATRSDHETDLVFETEEVTIIVSFEAEGLNVDVLGLDAPTVSVVDRNGVAVAMRFSAGIYIALAETIHQGSIRVEVRPPQRAPVTTDWFTYSQ